MPFRDTRTTRESNFIDNIRLNLVNVMLEIGSDPTYTIEYYLGHLGVGLHESPSSSIIIAKLPETATVNET